MPLTRQKVQGRGFEDIGIKKLPFPGLDILEDRVFDRLPPDGGKPMERVRAICDTLFEATWSKRGGKLRCKNTAELGTKKENEEGVTYIFKRKPEKILASGMLAGSGCNDTAAVFVELAKAAKLDVTRVLVTYEKGSGRPHTLVGIKGDGGEEIVLDPKWMSHPKYRRLKGKRDKNFSDQYDAWFRTGLPREDSGEREAYSRPAPSGAPRSWIVARSLPAESLTDGSYSHAQRMQDITRAR